MSVDAVAVSLSMHGAVTAGAVVAIWKLGGESKFATEKVGELHGLRPKLLRSVVTALELALTPVLTSPSAVEAVELDDDPKPRPLVPRFSVTGKEALTNAVREFVKSDSRGLLDLREAHQLESSLNQNLDHLRRAAWVLCCGSGLMTLLMTVAKFEWLVLTSSWVHVVGFLFVVAILAWAAMLFWCILHASGRVDRLRSSYVDHP